MALAVALDRTRGRWCAQLFVSYLPRSWQCFHVYDLPTGTLVSGHVMAMDRSKREVSDGLARNRRRRSDNRHPGPSVFDSWFRRDHLVIHKAQTIIRRMDDR